MTTPPPGGPAAPDRTLPDVRPEAYDRVDAPLGAGLAALARLRRRGQPTGTVAVRGDRLLLLLAPGSAEDVPELLRWLGWGHLDGVLRARPGICARAAPVPQQRPATAPYGAALCGEPPAPCGEVPTPCGALPTEHLPGVLDALADACARALMDGTPGWNPRQSFAFS